MRPCVDRLVVCLLPRVFAIVALACLLPAPPAWAQLPAEATDLAWCPATKDCLSWSAAPGATSYTVYRGGIPGLENLLDGALDSCAVGSYDVTTTGPSLVGEPSAGVPVWYLVTARNAQGEGSAGDASAGPRSLDSSGACVAGSDLVLNEVDYDQIGTDSGEFIEIYNARPTARDLAGLVLILVNGGTGEEYRRHDLTEAGASLPAGGYLVVGSPNVVAALPPGTLAITFGSSANNMQNGAPDGVALFDTSNAGLLDALSYEGSISGAQFTDQPGTFNLVEGTAATAQDSNSADGSLCRSPNGSDTNDADSDWHFVTVPSPGAPNASP